MLGRREDNARLQSDFYRDQYRKMLKWVMISVLMIFALLTVVCYLVIFKPAAPYYANTVSGKILAMPKPL